MLMKKWILEKQNMTDVKNIKIKKDRKIVFQENNVK